MHTAIGVFSTRDAAEAAYKELVHRNIPPEEIVFLTRSETEGTTIGKEVGATVGGFMGFAAGMSAGVGAAVLLAVPGVGQIAALGFGAAALLGLTGAGAGSALGKLTHGTSNTKSAVDPSAEDVAFFHEVLAEGRSLVVVRTESDESASHANEVLNRLGISLHEHTPVKLQMSTRQLGDISIIDMGGRISLGEGSAMLREQVRELTDKGQRKILLNLRNVGYIDSSGLGELVKAHTTALSHGGQLKLVDVSKRVRDLLHTTKLNLVLEIEADEATALQSFRKVAAS
jgi:anti-sigma B factor antagonist